MKDLDIADLFAKIGTISEAVLSQFEQKGIGPGLAISVLNTCLIKRCMSEGYSIDEFNDMYENLLEAYELTLQFRNENL